MAKLISKTYGEALYELAMEENIVDELLLEVQMVRKIFAEDTDFIRFMNHPQVTREEKADVIEHSLKGRVSDNLTGFIELIVEKGRFKSIDSIFAYFIDAVKEQKGIGIAYVSTPMALSEIQKSEISEKLLSTTRYNEMEMNYQIDVSLIGGMVIRIGDRVVDTSIKSKLYALTKNLQKIQLQK